MAPDDLPLAAKALRDQILRLRPDLTRVRTRYFVTFLIVTVLLTSAITGGLLAFYPHVDAIFPLAVSLPLLLCFTVFRVCDISYRKKTRLMLIETLSITSGFKFTETSLFGDKDMSAHAILPPTDRVAAGDGFNGSYNDVPLALQDLTVGKKTAPIHCLAARIKLRRPLDGHTVVTTANAAKTYFKGRFADTYGKVGVTNMKYDRQVDIFATERTEARLLADAVFIELLMETGLLLKSRWLAASFLKGEILLLFEAAHPLLRLPPLWSPVGQESLLHIYRQFESLFRIIDAARANKYL
jgi:hypothetical protein